MDGNTIRRRFLDFFTARDHTEVPSASLIPVDPTLLLTNAGMVPFKPYLLGEQAPPYVRAVSVQKVARTVDIDIVGTTARHATFFEMLGNFSFGDYYKTEAIGWAYEFITEHLGFDPDRLWYTIHHTDDEAAEIWLDGVGVSPDRLQRRDRDNFWQMGVPGPCGPSSEIFYDKGPEYGDDGGPVVDEERFVEFWNLVFMQNVQDEPYHVVGDLPAKNIDTGAGLERVATILQGVDSLFDTDLVRPIIATAEARSGVVYGSRSQSDVSLRILGDHGKALTMLVADGVVPSNEGRGYVLRRLLRRAVRHAYLLGVEDLIVPDLVEMSIEVMSDGYPELVAKRDFILEMAEREEVRFRRTLASGHQLLDTELEDLDAGGEVSGETAFKLHDTYGFPVDLTEEIVAERGYTLNRSEFETMMSEQRDRARAAWKGTGTEATDHYVPLIGGLDPTSFVGYESYAAAGKVLAIVREGDLVDEAGEGQDVEIFLDASPFYAESGGQVGDTGMVTSETGSVRIDDTQFSLPGIHGHRGTVSVGSIKVGQDVSADIDPARREHVRKNHTGTHILHWALRDVIGDHVKQAGSLVAPDRLRFDFSHFEAPEAEALSAVEAITNRRVIDNDQVTTVETSKSDAESMGALAFFGDKYGDQVRVVRTGDYSVEFCGGTHVPSTGQVGPVVLVAEGSVGANLRRLEALTGVQAYEHLVGLRRSLNDAEGILRAQPGQLLPVATSLMERIEANEQRLATFEARARSQVSAELADSAEGHGPWKLVVAQADVDDPDALRMLALQIRERIDGIGVVGASIDGKGSLIAFVSPALAELGVSAGEIIGDGARELGGGGSRDPELAQAGGPHGDQIGAALESAAEAARSALTAL